MEGYELIDEVLRKEVGGDLTDLYHEVCQGVSEMSVKTSDGKVLRTRLLSANPHLANYALGEDLLRILKIPTQDSIQVYRARGEAPLFTKSGRVVINEGLLSLSTQVEEFAGAR